MTQKDVKTVLDAVAKVLRDLFTKRDAQIANLQQRVDALEKKLAKLLD